MQKYLGNKLHDFDLNKIKKVQNIRSHESQLMQLTDILIGAVGYSSRSLDTSSAKLHIMNHIKSKSNYTLTKNTLYREDKFNMLFWNAQKG